jgi:hypothetical protein
MGPRVIGRANRTLESNLPDSIRELARFAGTDIRSRSAAADPRHNQAAAAAIPAGRSQFLGSKRDPDIGRETAVRKKNRGVT